MMGMEGRRTAVDMEIVRLVELAEGLSGHVDYLADLRNRPTFEAAMDVAASFHAFDPRACAEALAPLVAGIGRVQYGYEDGVVIELWLAHYRHQTIGSAGRGDQTLQIPVEERIATAATWIAALEGLGADEVCVYQGSFRGTGWGFETGEPGADPNTIRARWRATQRQLDEESASAAGSVRRYLDVSTAHLAPDERAFLGSRGADESDVLPRVVRHAYGVFVSVSDEEADLDAALADLFPTLARVLVLARRLKCEWINFDEGGDRVPGLPLYEEDL